MNLSDIYETEKIMIEDINSNKEISKIYYSPKYKKADKEYIYAPLRKNRDKWLEAKPEEIVRQNFICTLINEFDYKLEQMGQEVKVTNSNRGTGRASADIVIWKTKEDKEESNSAFLVVECKAENIKVLEKDYYQGYNYATWAGAKIFVTTNQKETKIFEVLPKKMPKDLKELTKIPNASIINNDKELKKELEKTEVFKRDEFARLLFQCHTIIRNNDKLSPESAFDEISKILFMKIRYERNPDKYTIFSKKKFEEDEQNYLTNIKPYIKGEDKDTPYIQFLFRQTKEEFKNDELFESTETINIKDTSFKQIVKKLEIYNLSKTSDDIKGIAFEEFLGRTFRGELGQFFTPRVVVDFIIELLEPKEGEIICDPCSGSGGFLIKTFEYIRESIEKDIEEQKTKIQEKYFGKDFEKLDDETLRKKVDEESAILSKELIINQKDKKDFTTRLDKLSKNYIYGTDANPRMARVSKMNMIMHGDGHGGVHHNDGLLNINGIFENRFDVIVTNPPFGTRLDDDLKVEKSDKYTDEEKKAWYIEKYGDDYKTALKQVDENIGKSILSLYNVSEFSSLTEVLFLDRCLNLLKDGGRVGIVLPEGVLNSNNLEKVREYFEGRAKFLLIVSLPQEIFMSSGASVKTSLVFMKKLTEKERTKYKKIKEQVVKDINWKYQNELESVKSSSAQKNKIKKQIIDEIKETLRVELNYTIPISDITKAGINAVGGKEEDSQLPELLKIFTTYRKKAKLWNEK